MKEQIAAIEWIDAFGCPPGWEFEDEAKIRATKVNSVGYVLSDDEDFVMLAPHVSSPGDGERRQLAGHIAIPRKQILGMQIISSSVEAASCQVLGSTQNQQAFSPPQSNSSAGALCLRARRFLKKTFHY